uniref:hypothetical protein n=1 Tax=Saccharolobus solfataricus TaxID=2287 RepID=UPI0001C384FD
MNSNGNTTNETKTETETNLQTNDFTKTALFTTVNSKQKQETEVRVTVPFAVRIDVKYYSLYKNFNKKQKDLVKYLVEAVIAAVAEGKSQTLIEFNEMQPTVINLNANINMN